MAGMIGHRSELQKSRNRPRSVRSCQRGDDEHGATATSTTRRADGRVTCSLVALPDAVVSTLAGIFDVLNGARDDGPGDAGAPPFAVEIVGEAAGPLRLASGVPFEVQRSIDRIESTDIVIVPSILLKSGGWAKGRYPRLVDWLKRMHERGAVLCSACSGIFLLAETGLFDGKDATVHFGYARAFATAYPQVPIHPERVLVIAGRREELVSSGASKTWHDLVLYLIARYAGATAAQEVARIFALQWHQDGLAPYIVFEGRTDHGDAEIAGRTGVAGKALLGRQPGRGNDQALQARRAHLQAALHAGHRACAARLRAAPARRRREAPARAHRRAGRRGQLARRLRGPGVLPTSVQAHHRHGTGCLSQALSHS